MTISGTYRSLQLQIADELGDRQDLLTPLADSNLSTSPIQNAIQSAITMWEREPFYFNELYDTSWFQTVIGQEFYSTTSNPGDQDISTIASLTQIVAVHINPSLTDPNRYPLEPRTWQYLDRTSVNSQVTSSYPSDYAYFGEMIRLYPIPAQVSQLTVSGIERFTNLASDNDANAWTQDAYDLIRSTAKLILAQEVLYDDDIARRMKLAIYGDPDTPSWRTRGYLSVLKAETTRRGGSSKIVPTFF